MRPFLIAAVVLLVATAAVRTSIAQTKQKPYDPNQNMALDGTTAIKPKLPADLPNPDRWRYTPGGRIKPGNMFDRFLVTTWVTPILFREEDIGFGGGLAITDIDFRNQGWREFANIVASHSSKGQQTFRFDWRRWLHHRPIPEGGVIRDERTTISGGVEYSRTLTRRFFGFGSRTPVNAETSYTEEVARLHARALLSLPDPGDDLLVSIGATWEHHGLEKGRVTGVPSTDQIFGQTFREAAGVNQLWLRGHVSFDTRDSITNPYSGWRVGLTASVVPLQTNFDAIGAVVSLDASSTIQVPGLFHDGGDGTEDNPPTDVLSVGGFVSATAGDLPFYSLPRLGGDNTLRGFIPRRFADRVAAHGSLEYRLVVLPRGIRFTDTIRFERLGLAAFYDFGTVAGDLGALGRSKLLQSYGLGVRIGLQREAVFRIDLGFSDEGAILTVVFGNSF
ncbi:MAG: hypothetical protein CMJ85_12790 [Planctomycetes bacterium]|jgi:hypothetical protein|nr:hypothetical protein [Planctomycetota bacterium]